MLTFSFNIFVFFIFIGIMIIGYTTGFVKEIKKILHLSIPLIIFYFWGRKITTSIYLSKQFQYIIKKLSFIKISYFDTFLILIIVLIIIYFSYLLTKTIVRMIDKRFHLEIIKYKLGKYNNYLGILFSLFRFYIILSILVIPFFIFNFTSSYDFTTDLTTNNALPFSELAYALAEIEEVKEITNSLITLKEVIDVDYLRSQNKLLNNLQLDDEKYRGIKIWLDDENIKLETIEYEELLISFINNYEKIINNTDDKKVKTVVNNSYDISRIYLVVNNWLKNAELSYNDDNFEAVLKQLVIDRTLINKGIYYELSQLKIKDFDKKITLIKSFSKKYIEVYKPKMDKLPITMPFKYKLIATILNDSDFIPAFKNNPLFSFYLIDSLKHYHKNKQIFHNESVYQTLIKVIIPLYIIEDEFIDEEKMTQLINEIDYSLNNLIITEEFFLSLMKEVVKGNEDSYLSYLLKENLVSIEAVKELEIYLNKRFKSQDITSIIKALKEVGEINGA